jgi:hypothetical protein
VYDNEKGVEMEPLPDGMKEQVTKHLIAAQKAGATALAIIAHPSGHRDETLENLLNEAQDEAYAARRAFRNEAARV